jgi:hypothetical protein
MRLRYAVVLSMLFAASTPAFADSFASVDDALEAIRRGKPYRAKVSKSLAVEAAQRIRDSEDRKELKNLIRLTKVGGAELELAQALMARAAEFPETLDAYRFLLKVRPDKVAAAAKATPEWVQTLRDAIDEADDGKGKVPREPVIFLGRHGKPADVLEFVTRWADEESVPPQLAILVSELARNAYPAKLLEPLCSENLRGLGALEKLQANAIRSMVSRDPAVAALALSLLEKRQGNRAMLLGCLGAVPQKHRDRARAVITKALTDDLGDDLEAAVVAAGLLKATGSLSRILDLAESGEEPVQVAALRVIPKLVARLYKAKDKHSDTKVKNEDKLLRKNEALRNRCTDVVKSVLQGGVGPALAAAIAVGKRLKLREALPPGGGRAMAIDTELGVEARRAAIYAIPFTCVYDSSNVDLLLELMKDPDVKVSAHVTLKQFARVRIPLRLDQWMAWRERQTLLPGEDRSNPKYYKPPVGWADSAREGEEDDE